LSTSASVKMALVSVLLDAVVVTENVADDCTEEDEDISTCVAAVTVC